MNYNNLAQSTNFIAGSDKFNNVPFFITGLNIPGININHPEISGGRQGTLMNLSGDSISYNSLSFEMLIDEDFQIYQELMDIVRKNISPTNGTYGDFYFDFFIEINNSKGNKILKLEFSNCRIASIGDIQLSTQDEATEYSLSMEIVYDYYIIEPLKRYTFIGNEAPVVVNDPFENLVQQTFSEDFTTLSNEWQLWGFPSPILSNDAAATNGIGFDSNGSGSFGSGAVLNTLEIDVTKPFDFTFRVKQPLGADSNDGYYLDFGITEGIGIQSTSNGRTGSTVMGVILDGGSYDGTSIKSNTFVFKNAIDDVKANYANDGQYHDYRFVYTLNGLTAEYQIYLDNVLQSSVSGNISTHDFFYLYIQGKSDGGIQVVDTITGNYGEVV